MAAYAPTAKPEDRLKNRPILAPKEPPREPKPGEPIPSESAAAGKPRPEPAKGEVATALRDAALRPKDADGPKTIVTPEGANVTLEDRAKIVHRGGEEVEVRRLTREEKAARRRTKNIVMMIVGIILLAVAAIVLRSLSQ